MKWCWMVFLVLIVIKDNQVYPYCRNEYADGIRHITVGRPASYNPPKRRYTTNDIVRFTCPKGFHFEEFYWREKRTIWIECGERKWRDSWPACRGPTENATCENEYKVTPLKRKKWQNPTPNLFHAIYTPERDKYLTLTSVKFSCLKGMFFKGSKGLSFSESRCLEDRRWSREWPMCKGHTCDRLDIDYAIVDDENRRLFPGTVVNIKCQYGLHLWGLNRSTCEETLQWSGYPRECVTSEDYRDFCEQSHRIFKLNAYGDPLCIGDTLTIFSTSSNKDRTKRVTLSVAIPLSALFVILLTVSSLYVHRLRLRQQRMAAAVLFQNADETVNMVLPSYEDAMKSKPTTPPPTFEETFSFSEPDLDPSTDFPQSQPLRHGSPPEYEQ